jgi:hypothetical protein
MDDIMYYNNANPDTRMQWAICTILPKQVERDFIKCYPHYDRARKILVWARDEKTGEGYPACTITYPEKKKFCCIIL